MINYFHLFQKYLIKKLNTNNPTILAQTSNKIFFTSFFTNTTNIYFLIYTVLSWIKARTLYYVNNWVYTTNHKRIAVNYFWFVIFSGICGMVLATIIRLEMAYPGVGILAGDSLQYLSVVTAHAVIMVFFMIMPLLFGAFGNFLLPTQLGVHDVAFPRLNSVAFWFLPGGLIMLCQLVCLDRRYQRMNCFNIREIQTLLKARFYADLLNENSRHLFLSRTTSNLKFKLQDLNFLNLNSLLLNRYGVSIGLDNRTQGYNLKLESPSGSMFYQPSSLLTLPNTLPTQTFIYTTLNLIQDNMYKPFKIKTSLTYDFLNHKYMLGLSEVKKHLLSTLKWSNTYYIPVFNFFNNYFITSINPLDTLCLTIKLFCNTIFLQKSLYFVLNFNFINFYNIFSVQGVASNPTTFSHRYITNAYSIESLENQHFFNKQESFSNYRFQRLQNPIFRYDFKLGNYMPDENKKKSPFLYTTIHDLTTGVRKPNWIHSPDFLKLIWGDLSNYFLYHSGLNGGVSFHKFFTSFINDIYSSHVENDPFYSNLSNSSGFYNYIYFLSDKSQFVNHRWTALNSLNQKFYKMFLTSSMQQRIYGNWRQLKFTREAWRCKLLAARHQNTLHKRYVNEDSTVWSVERNAKDLLPGWAMITPFSARTRFTAIGKVDLGLMGVFLVLNSSIVASSNFLITYRYLSTLNNRKMRDARSFFTEGVMVASWMMIAANPMLAIGILMLLSDRHWQTSFFDYSGGGWYCHVSAHVLIFWSSWSLRYNDSKLRI